MTPRRSAAALSASIQPSPAASASDSPPSRAGRDAAGVARLLAALEDAARTGENLMPRIVAAVSGSCTLGEISLALEKVFGRYSPGSTAAAPGRPRNPSGGIV